MIIGHNEIATNLYIEVCGNLCFLVDLSFTYQNARGASKKGDTFLYFEKSVKFLRLF